MYSPGAQKLVLIPREMDLKQKKMKKKKKKNSS